MSTIIFRGNNRFLDNYELNKIMDIIFIDMSKKETSGRAQKVVGTYFREYAELNKKGPSF